MEDIVPQAVMTDSLLLTFAQVAYSASLPEDIPSNKIILKVSAKDADIGSNGEIRYSLYGSGNNEFFLDPESGKVKFILWGNAIIYPCESLSSRMVSSAADSYSTRALIRGADVLDTEINIS